MRHDEPLRDQPAKREAGEIGRPCIRGVENGLEVSDEVRDMAFVDPRGAAMSAQVRADDPEPAGQAGGDRIPARQIGADTMHEDEGRAAAVHAPVQFDAVRAPDTELTCADHSRVASVLGLPDFAEVT